MRGYAPTEIPADNVFQTAALATDVVALIDALGYDSAVVFGHDWGASTVCGASVLAPDKIKKLIVASVPYGPSLGTALFADPEQQRLSWYMFFFQTALADKAVPFNDYAFIDRLWQDWSPGWQYPTEEMAALKETLSGPGVLPAVLGYYRAMFQAGFRDPNLSDLQGRMAGELIKVPTLYLHGENDGCIGSYLSDGMDALFTGGYRREILPNAGHFLHQERPLEVNQLVDAFLEE
ncbi:MAG: alpha/beta hydrolase, partial [Deltaproteobacteria bacterium]|nr:alpha/beta hydrolase [Deltaproteobacteria bacterium]